VQYEEAAKTLTEVLGGEEQLLPGLKLSEYILKLGRQGQVAGFEFALHEKHHSQAGIVQQVFPVFFGAANDTIVFFGCSCSNFSIVLEVYGPSAGAIDVELNDGIYSVGQVRILADFMRKVGTEEFVGVGHCVGS
jgi:hypothetical protein